MKHALVPGGQTAPAARLPSRLGPFSPALEPNASTTRFPRKNSYNVFNCVVSVHTPTGVAEKMRGNWCQYPRLWPRSLARAIGLPLDDQAELHKN